MFDSAQEILGRIYLFHCDVNDSLHCMTFLRLLRVRPFAQGQAGAFWPFQKREPPWLPNHCYRSKNARRMHCSLWLTLVGVGREARHPGPWTSWDLFQRPPPCDRRTGIDRIPAIQKRKARRHHRGISRTTTAVPIDTLPRTAPTASRWLLGSKRAGYYRTLSHRQMEGDKAIMEPKGLEPLIPFAHS